MALTLTGVLWVNGTTVISDQSAYNNGLQRVADYANAHTLNTTQGSTAPDQHDASHIKVLVAQKNITQPSSNAAETLDLVIAEIMARIHAIEGQGADWASGSAATTLKIVSDAIANHTIVAATATTAG
ncbi:MAG: hypothetical protein LC793_16365, partial [Thermomicrobia bacterium]|nr:hypothetical protein [Thermomicrobia bacterium]